MQAPWAEEVCSDAEVPHPWGAFAWFGYSGAFSYLSREHTKQRLEAARLGSSCSPGLCLGGGRVVFGRLVVVVRMTSPKLLSESVWRKDKTPLPSQTSIWRAPSGSPLLATTGSGSPCPRARISRASISEGREQGRGVPGFPGRGKGLGVGLAGLVVVSRGSSK